MGEIAELLDKAKKDPVVKGLDDIDSADPRKLE